MLYVGQTQNVEHRTRDAVRGFISSLQLKAIGLAERKNTAPKPKGFLVPFFALGHDVLRHTYISMTVGAFRSIGDAALQAGNSEAVIRKHYLDLKSTEEADQFWQIVPQGTRLPKLEKKDGRFVKTG